ncbi:MAG: hypothetical protein KJZ80_20080 [Hyphomicrobiaceae bacterium]|nr:hypothetical protein [Hyphomicrobiaceae bacterium]
MAGRSPSGKQWGRIVIICSCAVISDRDVEQALIEILSRPGAPLPTPGVVYRHMSKSMACCGCAPLAVSTIYALVEKLEREGRVCPDACATAKSKLIRLDRKRLGRNKMRAASFSADAAQRSGRRI